MANEKVYVGEEGAKELYRKIKALIPGAVTVVDEVSLNSMDAVTSHAVAVAVGNLTGFQPVDGTGADDHPNVNTPNTRTIYLVKIPEIVGEDKYKEWIWVIPEQGAGSWECIGSTSIPENAWKQWSEDNGSSGVGDSVYLGKNNTLTRNDTYALGKGNTATITDATDYSNTDVVMLGTSNSTTNAANAYQIGRDNSVTDNNLEAINTYPHQTAINLGVHNTITSEGVNLGKDNAAYGFGVTLGQGNTARYGSYAFGNRMEATSGSIAIGGNDNGGYSNGINVLFYVDGNTATLAEKVKKHDTYTYRLNLVPVKNESGKYVWQSLYTYDTYVIFSNTELHKHILILLGNLNFDTTVKYGYFDSNEEFVETSSSDSRAKPYYHFLTAYDRQGNSYDVSSFYCSLSNGKPVQTNAGYFYYGQPIPIVGWVYDQAGYEDAIAHFYDGGLTPVDYLYVNDSDASIATNNSYYVTEFDVYGYYDSNKFIPYNETNKNGDHNFEWVTVSADKIELRNIIDPDTAGVERETPIADGASILLGKSGHVSGNSIGIIGSELQLVATFEAADSLYESETSYKKYEINQTSGSYSYSSYSKSFIKANNSFTSNYSYVVGNKRSYIDGISFGIVLNDNYSTKSTTITGNSLGIGSGLDVGGNSYSIGQNNFVRNNSFVLGKENTDVWNKSIVTGFNNASIYENAVVYGCNNTRIGRQQSQSESPMGSSVVIGYSSQQVWGSSLAIGFDNACVTDNSVSVGSGCSYIDDASIGIGQGNRYITSSAVAIGSANTYVSGSAFVFGSMNSNILDASIAIGSFHTNIGEASIAMGLRNSVNTGSIALGEGLTAKNTSFVVGRGSTGDGASIVLGNGNSGVNAAFVIGIGNRGNFYGDNAIHTNAVILGLGNSVYNHRTAVPGISDNGVCSFVAGSYISVYGHNGIGIGSGHIIGDSSKWAQDTTTGSIEPDNDGFMTAIGYKCEALRNYDFAFGYKSVAKGGENIAITNSEAIGYRNLAYNHSKVNGICNILLNESVLDCKRWDDEPLKIEYNTFNTLNNSNVSYKCVAETESNTGVTFFGNRFEGVRCELVASAWGVHANVMLGNGPRIDDSYSTWSNDPDIKIAAGTISNNIIADSKQHFEIALGNKDSSNSIEQNLFMFNDVQMYNIKQLRQNMFISSVLNVEMDSNAIGKGYFYDNIIANSIVTGRLEGSTLVPGGVKANTINHNVILGKSNLCLNNTPGTVEFNVLLGHSTLDAYHEKAIWSNSTDGIKCNFLFGSSARKAHDCVSFGDGGGAYLENAMHSRNFGDNTLYNTNKVFVAGDGNALNAVQHSVVFGETNEFNSDEYYGRRDLSSASNIHMSEIFVHGISNKFNYTGGSSFFSRLFVAGNANTVNGNNVHDSSILGSNNTIGWFENGVPAKKTCEEVWSFNVNKPTIIEVTDRGYLPSNGTSTVSVYSGDYYYYRGGAVYEVYSASSYTSISGNDFVQKVRNKELVDNSYYYITSSVQGDKAVLQLNAITDYSYLCEYYTKYPDGTVRSTSLANMGTHILGCQAKIAPNVMWSTILGAEHKVTNSLPYGISGLLVQGMSQTVSDGSNIICMGAGNVSSGHGSIAIGNQLISDKWQTVIGKYNKALPGPERTIPKHDENKTYNAGDIVYDSLGSTYYKCTSSVPTVGMMQNSLWTEVDPDSEKALFIVGNGYGESDGSGDWNDETKIHRSNAMVVYADGTVKAKKFVSDEPEMELSEGTGIKIEKSVSSGTVTISVRQPLPATPTSQGTYALQCVVDSNGEPTLSWVAIGMSNV